MGDEMGVEAANPPKSKRRRRQPPYAVVVFNDDEHTLQYVVETFMKVFG